MDFDFLDRHLLDSTKGAVESLRQALELARPAGDELEDLYSRIRPYAHTTRLKEEFLISAVDGSGEYPVFQQDDIFLHFATAAGVSYQTSSAREHKLSSISEQPGIFKSFVLLSDNDKVLRDGYRNYLKSLVGLSLQELVHQSDYCEVFSQFGKAISPELVTWQNLALSKASQVATHAYLLRSMAELGMGIRMLEHGPRYLLIDTSLVYFLLGESIYLPEILKRHLIKKATEHGTAVVALCKSHNLPNGDLLARYAREELNLNDHWYLRLPSAALWEPVPTFLSGKEIPPKLSVSYLFKFEATEFPMRIDVDAGWWKSRIGGDQAKEEAFFADLDFTCHEVRSYGYPYPMHAAHRKASLTRQERAALRDILIQSARQEGLVRGGIPIDPELLHMSGM